MAWGASHDGGEGRAGIEARRGLEREVQSGLGMTRSKIALLASLLVACTHDPAPSARESAPDRATPRADGGDAAVAPVARVEAMSPRDAWIVWARDAEAGARSYWVEREDDGSFAVRAQDGIVIAADGQLWRWAVHEEELSTSLDCEWPEIPPAGGTGARVVLERVDGEGARELFAPDRVAAFESNEWHEGATLEASVGPYLFVHRSAWGFQCGAHGGSSDAFDVIDARTGEPVELAVAPTEALRQRAWAELEAQEVFAEDASELTPTMFRPVFDASPAGMAIEHQLTASTCYACSDGQWDSYTASARVRGGEVPAELAAVGAVPAEVLAVVRERFAPAEIGGVSRTEVTLREAFEAGAR